MNPLEPFLFFLCRAAISIENEAIRSKFGDCIWIFRYSLETHLVQRIYSNDCPFLAYSFLPSVSVPFYFESLYREIVVQM